MNFGSYRVKAACANRLNCPGADAGKVQGCGAEIE